MGKSVDLLLRMASISCLYLAIGCSGDSHSGPPSGDTIVKSALTRNLSPQVSDSDVAAVITGNTQMALNVFNLVDSNPDHNTFFSPYSITQAFLLLAPGAQGSTLSGIQQALTLPIPQDRLNSAFDKIDLLIAADTTGALLPDGLATPKLDTANAVWGQKGLAINPGYLDALAVNYGAGLHTLDFLNASEDSRQTINNWVAAQTDNKIQNLVPLGGISSDTRLVLSNAVSLKADWASPFPHGQTFPGIFHNRDGSSSAASFMSQTFSVSYANADGCDAFDLPYAGNQLSMLVMMPAAGTFDQFLSALTPTVLADINNNLAAKQMAFAMPKFSFTKTAPLKTILPSLGMVDAFDATRADFSGIDGSRDLVVGDVFHQAFIKVDEQGTEAAAATAVIVGIAAIPGQPPTIDHPFIFLIRDRQTGLVLFMGKVVAAPSSM